MRRGNGFWTGKRGKSFICPARGRICPPRTWWRPACAGWLFLRETRTRVYSRAGRPAIPLAGRAGGHRGPRVAGCSPAVPGGTVVEGGWGWNAQPQRAAADGPCPRPMGSLRDPLRVGHEGHRALRLGGARARQASRRVPRPRLRERRLSEARVAWLRESGRGTGRFLSGRRASGASGPLSPTTGSRDSQALSDYVAGVRRSLSRHHPPLDPWICCQRGFFDEISIE